MKEDGERQSFEVFFFFFFNNNNKKIKKKTLAFVAALVFQKDTKNFFAKGEMDREGIYPLLLF